MRYCRFQRDGKVELGVYEDTGVVPLIAAAHVAGSRSRRRTS